MQYIVKMHEKRLKIWNNSELFTFKIKIKHSKFKTKLFHGLRMFTNMKLLKIFNIFSNIENSI